MRVKFQGRHAAEDAHGLVGLLSTTHWIGRKQATVQQSGVCRTVLSRLMEHGFVGRIPYNANVHKYYLTDSGFKMASILADVMR